MNLILYGPPGAGKTTIGQLVAARLNYQFIDGDDWIEKKWSRSVVSYFDGDAVSAFRARETEACRTWSALERCVIAPGGGALINPHSRAALAATGVTLCLTATLDTLLSRLNDSHPRPLLHADPRAHLAALLQERETLYNSFPLQISTDNRPPESIAEEVLALFRANEHLTRFDLPASTALMGHGLLNHLPELLASHHLQPPYLLISDSNTAPLYSAVISHALSPSPDDAFGLRRQETRSGRRGEVVFPAGESSKTLDTLRALYSACLAHSLDRHGTILALGGGVVGDVAGFVAATFMRGVRWVNLPTTILAMADSSLGGKVGVDLPEGKNLVGAFHPPTLILADFDTLATLPAIETRCGLAEIIKSALIADPALFSEINSFYNMNQHPEYSEAQSKDVLPSAPLLPSEARSPAAFPCPPAFVTRAASIKVGFVTSDPFEKAERAKLNLGHTIGHGVESASGYALRHGEAVAIGLVAEARLAETLGLAASGLAEQIATCLQNVGLPTRCVGLDPHAIRAAMSGDKKKSGGQLKFTLPKNIGEVEFGIEVEEQTLSAILEQITHA